MKTKPTYALFAVLLFTVSAIAQSSHFNTQRNWSLNKKELLIGLGGTQFLGDLGGRDAIGTDYSLVDLDFPMTRYGGMLGFRYRFHPFYATTTSFNIGMLGGDDKATNEIVRHSRNLHFRSIFISLQQRFEIILFAKEKVGARFNLRGHRKRMKGKNTQFYIFGGVGATYFNPKAKYNGSWVALRPLRTEGQGLPGGPQEYSRITAIIPAGVGFRMGIGTMWRLGIEGTYYKTFTDYIDDVGGVYYDPDILATQVGAESAYLSNPAIENTTWFGPGQQRGDNEKDTYFTMNIVLYRNITYKDYSKARKAHRWKGRYKF